MTKRYSIEEVFELNHNYLWYTKDKYEEKCNELNKSVIE